MRRPWMLDLSLAAKCRLLFGAAVVLIIASALYVPWRSVENFVQDRNNRRARSYALIARALMDVTDKDWSRQQSRLNQWWQDNAGVLKLPEDRPPLLVPLPEQPAFPSHRTMLLPTQAVAKLLRQPLRFVFQGVADHPVLNLAAGVVDAAVEPLASSQSAIQRMAAKPSLRRMALAMLTPHTELDGFQIASINLFQGRSPETHAGPEIPNEAWRTERAPGRPQVSRYILAVRGDNLATGGRPLLGLIDVRLETPDSDATLLWTRVVIILAGLLAGLLAILVFYLIVQKFILAPVRELTEVAGQIAGGDMTARAAIETGDEFQDLGEAFNDMLGQLERARVDLETINRSLDTRLGELAQRNVALFESNRLKSEFLANVSHELRTPMTSIIGFADLLRDMTQTTSPLDQSRATRFAHNILVSGRHLLDLINDLLDLAKIEAGRVELHRTRFSLPDICEAMSDFMRPLIEKKQQTLTMELAPDLPMVYSDASKIRQILYNLLSNAVKYTPDGGEISVRVESTGGGNEIRMSVSDTGPGIALEDQDKIFEKFRQLDGSVTREHTGSGLGLAISKELAFLLGGKLSLVSKPGQGATFTVELPIECPDQVVRPLPSLT